MNHYQFIKQHTMTDASGYLCTYLVSVCNKADNAAVQDLHFAALKSPKGLERADEIFSSCGRGKPPNKQRHDALQPTTTLLCFSRNKIN